MKTLTQSLKAKLSSAATSLFEECQAAPPEVRIEIPSDAKYGDYATNLAMQLAPVVKDSPLRIANKLKDRLGSIAGVEAIEIVAPGFMNFRISALWLGQQVSKILKEGRAFGNADLGKGKRLLLEFVSANPTGPIQVGNGRGAFLGDTLANVFAAAGYKPFREFYVNDAGKQVETLTESVVRRAFQLQGVNVDFPEELYQGEYVKDIARKINITQYKLKGTNEIRERIKNRVLHMMILELERVMEKKAHVRYHRWFKESELYAKRMPEAALSLLREKGLLYAHEGATWFKTTAFGDDKDRVVVKSDGTYTYIIPDVALRWDRFVKRKFDREVIILGADHHGYVSRLQAAVAALGFPGALDVILVQLVRLISNGEEVRMSKRAGTFVTLEELIDDVGLDVARFFFLMHSANAHMDFDLDLAKEKSEKNPVYYVQYAHARICSILKKTRGLPRTKGTALKETAALGLIKQLLRLPELVGEVATTYDCHKLPFYSMDVATAFHTFYDTVRVIDAGVVQERRLKLVEATKQVLENTLKLMGVSAPEKM